jgi:hypothetical protein
VTVYQYQDFTDDESCALWPWHMYGLSPLPPKYALNEYVRQYKLTNDESHRNFFLHYYEPVLNKRARLFCEKYHQKHRFQDQTNDCRGSV